MGGDGMAGQEGAVLRARVRSEVRAIPCGRVAHDVAAILHPAGGYLPRTRENRCGHSLPKCAFAALHSKHTAGVRISRYGEYFPSMPSEYGVKSSSDSVAGRDWLRGIPPAR